MISIDHKESVAVISLHGKLKISDVWKAVDELINHPDHKAGIDEIWDFSNADVSSFKADDLRAHAKFVKDRLPRLALRTAIVVATNAEFGIGRMWQAYGGQTAPQERYICRSIQEAFDWLEQGQDIRN